MAFQDHTADQLKAAMITTSEIYAKTQCEKYRTTNEWKQSTQILINVWRTMWSSSLPFDTIVAVGCAVYSLRDSEGLREELKAELKSMVRKGFLNSYQHRGQRHWELDLTGE